MKVIDTVRGAHNNIIYVSPSIIQVDGLDIDPSRMFVKAFTSEKSEKKGIIQCFNNVNHIYAFGQDPESSRYSCSVLAFLNAAKPCESFVASGALASLFGFYDSHRVSRNPMVVSMQIDTGAKVHGILVGIAAQVEDAERNLINVTFAFNDLDAAG